MRTNPVQEPSVMAYNQCAAGKIFQSFFQGTNSLHIQIIGRFVKHQNIARLFEHHAKIQTVLFTTRKHANLFVLISTAEIKPGTVGMPVNFPDTTFKSPAFFVNSPKFYQIQTVSKSVINSFFIIKFRTQLININKFYSLPNLN